MKYLLLILCLILTGPIHAQSSPENFNFQGFHMIGGKPANGNFKVTFKVFDQSSDGNELWTSGPIDDIPLVNGVYQRALGQNNGDVWAAIDWSTGNKFIEVMIGDVAKERTQLMAVPIAIGAHRAANGNMLGDVKHSILTELQFQSLHGPGWVLMDGRDITGSDLNNLTGMVNVPDVRGMFLRALNNGRNDGLQDPDGQRNIGVYQHDQFSSHDHKFHSFGGRSTSDTGDGINGFVLHGPSADHEADYGFDIQNSGGNETRPKNIGVNVFIKINR